MGRLTDIREGPVTPEQWHAKWTQLVWVAIRCWPDNTVALHAYRMEIARVRDLLRGLGRDPGVAPVMMQGPLDLVPL